MKRLGIFVFYDKNGIVSEYVKYLLVQLKNMIDYQIIVVNGILQPGSRESLLKIADEIITRENVGYDAGAYKDVFLNRLSYAELQGYDEIILCNDTFYGPFFPFQMVWEKVEKHHPDFWGLTRHQGGIFEDGESFPAHIQSYFLVLKKELFVSQAFFMFWNQEIFYWTKLRDVIKGFELKFTEYFEKRGFKSLALTDLFEYGKEITRYNENIYMLHSYELISKGICPVWKRKSCTFGNGNFENVLRTYEYIKNNTTYPVNLIKDHLTRLVDEKNWCQEWDFEKLQEFYFNCENVYIYGAGKCGKDMQTYFQYRKWKVAGILISRGEKKVGSEQEFKAGILKESDGIVVALGRKNLSVVVGELQRTLKAHQLFIPDYNEGQHGGMEVR